MKTILLPVDNDLTAGSTIDTAAQLALAFGSYVEGFHLSLEAPLIAPADPFTGAMIATPLDPHVQEERRDASRALFTERLAARGLASAGNDAESRETASFGWYESEDATGRDFLAAYARVFDITVLTRPESVGDGPRMSELETALFESGRPALLVPKEGCDKLGENILIAWNGTPEAARTVAFAKPLLRRAGHVAVVTLKGSTLAEPSGDQLVRYLRRNGISSEAHQVDAGGDHNGKGAAFLTEARRLGGDLVARLGEAARLREQMIFGGATRSIITEATVPVLLAH